MDSEDQNFQHSGPLHLTSIDWKNTHHRRSIAASLVQGVYILERDRQKQRQGPQALAPPWWDFFRFQLIRVLEDEGGHSIFGAIYEFKVSAPIVNHLGQNPPRFVIAFRGTLLTGATILSDLKLDKKVIGNNLQQSSRFHIAMQAVHHMASIPEPANIWLVGHSLGAAIALLAGKNMVKMGYFLETYLFNPPFRSAPIEQIKNQILKDGIHLVKSVCTAKIATAINRHRPTPQQNNPFVLLSPWFPFLFVNPSDPFSAEYIGYFESREKMVNIGARRIERVATQNSISSMFLGAFGGDTESLHLIPSAYLTINSQVNSQLSFREGIKQAHGIAQWWRPHFNWHSKLHQFK